MAGIFAEVSTDIQKLRQLKAEIENVKKALKGINVKVDIDIAQGLEAQLKSLTTQYDALVQKVSEAQGKILSSVNQINNASERIVKAQERLAQASGDRNAQGGVNKSNNAATQAETASVEAQAKAYEELKGQINGILGTREANIKRMLEEQNAIRLINEEIKKLEKIQGTSSSSSIQNRITQLNDSLLTHKAALSEVRQTLSNNAKLDNAAATSMNALSQSLSRMRIAYRDLTEEERNSPFGQQLLASIRQADAQIKELDASIGNHQRNVGNYAGGWNGLSMSIQQIGRELPSLAMGWNTFFLAISNNLPILADEIKRARTEYDTMKKSGQTAIPVWKQIASSLLSWQTALTVGITLLTLYGDEIINWVGGLFGADSAQKKLNESIKEFNQTLQQGQTEARLLFDAVKRTEEGTQGRAEAIRKINEEYREYLPNLLSESSSLSELDAAYKAVTSAIKEHTAAKMQAQAIEKIAEKSIKAQADALMNMRNALKGQDQNFISTLIADITDLTGESAKLGNDFTKTWSTVLGKVQYSMKGIKVEDDFYEILEDYVRNYLDAEKQIKATQESFSPFFNKEEADKALVQNKEHWESVKRQAQSVLDSIESSTLEKLRAGNITGIPDAIVQKYKQAQKDIQKANKELSSYDFSPKTNKKQKKTEVPSITVQDENIEFITPEEIQKNVDYHREMLDKYLSDYGNYQQKRLAIADMYALKISQAETDGEKRILKKQQEEALKELDFSEFKNSINFADVFGNLDEQTTEGLTDLRDKLKEYINAAAKDLRPEDLKELQDAFKNIDIEITGRTPFKELKRDLEEYKDAQEEVNRAQSDLNTVMNGGEVVVGWYEDKTGKLVKKLLTQEQAEKKLTKAQEKRQEAIAGIVSSSDEIAKRIGNVADMASKITDTLTNAFGLELNDEIQKTIDGLSGIAEGVTSINHAVMEGDIAGAIGGIFQTVGGVVNTLNGISSIFGYENESDPHLTEDLERLTQSNQDLELAINNLADKMEEASVADASDLYQQQKSYLEESMRNTQEMMQRSGAAYDKGFLGIGGTHSSNKRIDEAVSESEWRRISDIVGRTIGSAGDFWNLTSEEMYNVATNAADIYSKIKQYADDGYKDAAQYMDEYIQYYQELEELQDAYNEKLTSVSFDTVREDFRNALLDMEDDTEAFAENFESMMQNAILESMMTSTYDKKLRDWYKSFSSAMEGGELTSEEQKNLKQQWDSIVNQASEEWNAWKDTMGWDSGDNSSSSQQQASRRYSVTASQESIDETNGRLTGIQMAQEEIKNQSKAQTVAITELKGSIASLVASSQKSYDVADETRNILAQSYLELQEIRENTGAIVQPIKQMQKDIAEVKQNTARI